MDKPRRRKRAALGILIVPIVVAGGLIAFGRQATPKPKGSIVDAAKRENLDEVRAHVKAGISVNETSSSGHSALYEAAGNSDLEMVRLLLDNGATPNGESRGKNTALMAAAMAGNLEIVKLLVEKGAELFPFSKDGQTPLHAAASGGNAQIAAYLLDRGLDVNARRTSDKATPICEAASSGNWDCIELLLKRGGKVDATGFRGRPPVSLAILRRHRSLSRKLIDAGADVNIVDLDGALPLHFAIIAGDNELVKILLPITKNPGTYQPGGSNAVFLAVFYESPPEILQALIDAGVSLEQKGSTQSPLSVAIANDTKDLVEVLKKAGARE